MGGGDGEEGGTVRGPAVASSQEGHLCFLLSSRKGRKEAGHLLVTRAFARFFKAPFLGSLANRAEAGLSAPTHP